MQIFQPIKTSWQAIVANKSRSILTMLGIIIGISSVIIILSVGGSAQRLILSQIESVGSNLIAIFPGESEEVGPPVSVLGIVETSFVNEDLDAIRNPSRVSNLAAISGYVRGIGSIVYRDRDVDGSFLGTSPSYPEVEEANIARGRFYTQEDDASLARVVVLGSELKQDLFGDRDPLGESIKIRQQTFRVIGVFEERGTTGFQNPDSFAFMPLQTAQKIMLGIDYLSFARAKVVNADLIDQTIQDIRLTLREEHDLTGSAVDDFTIRTIAEALGVLSSVTDALRFFLAAIAAISLLVGGIGIMNIMFVAITERTREIGLRKAVGASEGDIVRQFVIESMVISLIGGIIGLAVGVALSLAISIVINALGYEWQFLISAQAVLLAVGFSLLIGYLFGIYPAYRASKLNPIEALRYE